MSISAPAAVTQTHRAASSVGSHQQSWWPSWTPDPAAVTGDARVSLACKVGTGRDDPCPRGPVALTGCAGSPGTPASCQGPPDSWSSLSQELLEDGFLGNCGFLGRTDVCSLILQTLSNSHCQYGTGEPAVLYPPLLSHSLHGSNIRQS